MATLENEYAYATELNLATLSELISIRANSPARITRQRNICLKMLLVCKDIEANIKWEAGRNGCGRVKDILDAAKTAPGNVQGALDQHVEWLNGVYNRVKPNTKG